MKSAIFFLFFSFVNSIDAMNRYPKLTSEEVAAIADDKQLVGRLAQEGRRIRAHVGENDFQLLENIWTEEDVGYIQEIYESFTSADSNRSIFQMSQTTDLIAQVSMGGVKTIFRDKEIYLEKLEFCGFATLIGLNRRTRQEISDQSYRNRSTGSTGLTG